MKRIIAIVLTICLLAVALPVCAGAQAPEDHALVRQIRRCYYNTLSATGEPNMDYLCGKFVAYQLYLLKVTTSPEIYNGSQFYGVYSKKTLSSGGYHITCYSGEKYSMEEALNAITHNGTKDAYNIMLCFDWTKSGGRYGHVMLIHGIIDGVVYAVDNFTTTIAGPEGNPIICSIERFADIYDSWSSFEGAVEFGVKEYASLCTSYATDMFVRMTEPEILLTQPAPVGENDSLPVRVALTGERLYVTDVVVGQDEVNYYRVWESGEAVYIPCAVAQPIRLNVEGLHTKNLQLETLLQPGDKGKLTGEIYSTASLIGSMELTVTDAQGEKVFYSVVPEARYNHDLKKLQVDFSVLAEGTYTVKLYAGIWNYFDNAGVVENQNQRVLVLEEILHIGPVQAVEQRETTAFPVIVKNGWLYEDGQWYCYRNGQPRVGWYCSDGVDYYLKEDGSVTTGWANINGEDRFFSDTGAMRTGWLIQNDGVRYMLFNGVSAQGWREIDGHNYFFDDNGILDESTIPEE